MKYRRHVLGAALATLLCAAGLLFYELSYAARMRGIVCQLQARRIGYEDPWGVFDAVELGEDQSSQQGRQDPFPYTTLVPTTLDRGVYSYNAEQVQILSSLDSLRYLEDWNESSRDTLALLAKIKNLRGLDLGDAYITDEQLKVLEGTRLESLSLFTCKGHRFAGESLAYLRGLPLKHLTITHGLLTNEHVSLLSDLPLETLELLGHADLDGDCGPSLAKLTSLKSLNLSHSEFDDRGVPFLLTLPELTALNLEATRITDASIDSLLKMRRLQALNISYSDISDAGATRLKAGLGPDVQVAW